MSHQLYGIEGFYEGRDSGDTVRWPVCWRMSREEAEQVKETCEVEAKCFYEDMQPLWEARAKATGLDSAYGRDWRRRKRGVDRSNISKQETRYRQEIARIDKAAHGINAKYAKEMLDPLFPTGCIEPSHNYPNKPNIAVEYRIIEFDEDPRTPDRGNLIIARAKLHGAHSNDDEDADEDPTAIYDYVDD